MDKVTQWTSAFLSYRCHEDLPRHCTVPTVHMTRWFVQYLAIYLQSWQFGQEHKYFDKSQFLILPNTSVPKCQLLQSFLAKVSLRKEAKKIPRTIIQKWDYQIGRHQTKQIAWSAWLVTITITMTPKLVRVRFNDWTQRILLAYVIRDARGRSPGSVVMGGYSCSDGCGFESQKYILDGH